MAGWPIVWKTWWCQGIWQLSGKCQGFYWRSGNCQGKILSGKSCLKLFIVNCIFVSIQVVIVGVYCVLNVKYVVSDHLLLHSYPTTDSNTSTGMIWVTLNMPNAAEECRRPSGNFTLSGEWSPWNGWLTVNWPVVCPVILLCCSFLVWLQFSD